ncbi:MULTISPECIES: tellurite resistance TerB family protein [Pseudomonas]|uniref:Putative membrane protein n=1 Tax=Pseudomonas fluorescens (strain Pf0-1) TaxID=205922 RepID=Q3KEG9_PSEPF|nr:MULTISPECIES: tellurite resistance TerB family protein [Pseudomonas]ABA73837.1 putative membrane protein [Pseudomonas fluorescens Pf0-1]MBL0795266.1 tellurite resistance TerB family protein [Pseudomonas sp. B7]MBY9027462.1 tellurite resistance TerB family protein [Pseudomonas fluorescens]MBY9033170.1 tellurite resistance TerB family protein [Pseudomonas fluorescens]MBY9039183.1 tellurite resistance TerB family protein [Pseudomonas fluorescens]
MNTSDLLEQLLRGQASAGQPGGASAGGGAGGLGGLLGGLLGGGSGGGSAAGGLGGLGGLLGGLLGGGGALGGGTQRRSGGTNYAALASLGMMAFQAYQAWQRSQASAAPQQTPQTADLLSGPQVEEHSHAVLRALIAAAKADGRIDESEKHLISSEIGRHTDDPNLQQWLDDEVAKPLDPTEVAQAAQNDPAMAAEMYLASVMLVDDQQDAERNYLDELAAALQIDPELQVHLEQQAKGTA